jgi:hypothetical protein
MATKQLQAITAQLIQVVVVVVALQTVPLHLTAAQVVQE